MRVGEFGRQWWKGMRHCLGEARSGKLTDQAAGLTYYGLLSLFPGLLVLVSILGFLGGPASGLDQVIGTIAPGSVGDFLRAAVDHASGSGGRAGLAGVVGLILAFWSASGYMAAFLRATSEGQDPQSRKAKRTLPLRLAMTAAVGLLMIVTVFLVVFTGDIARRAGAQIGIGTAGVTAWNIAKWPLLLALVIATLTLLYRLSHAGEPLRWVTTGSATAIILWLLVSAAFGVYLSTLASYQRTYGTLGGLIAFLVWLWLTNVVVLIGSRLDTELARQNDRRSPERRSERHGRESGQS